MFACLGRKNKVSKQNNESKLKQNNGSKFNPKKLINFHKRNTSKETQIENTRDRSDSVSQTVSIERVVENNRIPDICIINQLSPVPMANEFIIKKNLNAMNLIPPTIVYRKKNSHNITRNRNKRKKQNTDKKWKTKKKKEIISY
eukprot:3740_1